MTATRTLPTDSTFTTSDGTRLRVAESGTADAAVTVVLVHGWTLTRHTWDRVVTGLPAATGAAVRVVHYDLRGHGDSDPSPEGTATIARCADDLAELIAERVPRGPIVVAGHSMGGMTLMALAERHPELVHERIAGAALVATSSGGLASPGVGLPRPVAAMFNAGERRLRALLASSARARVSARSGWLRPGLRWLLFGRSPSRADIKDCADWVAGCHPASFAGFRESLACHERLESLAALRAKPAAVLAGLDDRLCPAPHARRMAAVLPQASFLVYAGAGHMLPLERDDEVTARIADVTREAVSR